MVNARLCEKTRPAFFFTSQRHLRARDVQILRRFDVIYKRKQKNRYIETLRDLSLGKKIRLRDKNVKNSRVRDANNCRENQTARHVEFNDNVASFEGQFATPYISC